jgi:7-carboxy-7-deazaguanine synthase
MMHKFRWEMLDTFYNELLNSGTPFFFKTPLFGEDDMAFLREVVQRYPSVEVMASIGNRWAPGSQWLEETRGGEPLNEAAFKLAVLSHTREIVEHMLRDPVLGRVRVIPQLHTLLWGNEKGR